MSALRLRNSVDGTSDNGFEARPPAERRITRAAASSAEAAAAAEAARQRRSSNTAELGQIVSGSSRVGGCSVAAHAFGRRAPTVAKKTASTAECVPADSHFERLFSLNVPQRLEGDITDRSFAAARPEARRQTGVKVLGGGRLHNAMEIVEILIADDDEDKGSSGARQTDDGAFEMHLQQELAKQYSIGKCVVWMESLRLTNVETVASTINPSSAAKTAIAAATTAAT